MAERLYVRCPACEHEFPSPIQMDRVSFESVTMDMNQTSCPSCRLPMLLAKEFLFFRDEG